MTETTGQLPTADHSHLFTQAAEPLTVSQCLVEVMRRVDAIAKKEDGPGYSFRGVDTVTKHVGPVLRQLGLLVLPRVLEHNEAMLEYGGKRTLGRFVNVMVEYDLIAPDGSKLVVGPIYGEAMDSGDKAGAKAMSVAYRTMWLQALCVPTGDKDPDAEAYTIAKPEATESDPEVVAKLEERVAAADNEGKLRTAYEAIASAYEGDQATITKDDYDRLRELVKRRKAEVMGA